MTDETTQADEIATELTLQLREPITFAKINYTELTLTEPTIGHLIAASKGAGQFDQLALLISHNAKVPMGVVTQLLQRDVQKAAAFYGPFSEALPQT